MATVVVLNPNYLGKAAGELTSNSPAVVVDAMRAEKEKECA